MRVMLKVGSGLPPADVVQVSTTLPMASALAYLPFRVVYVPTAWLGRIVAWLADGYRAASPVEKALILPTWALLRGLFIVGCALAHVLHAAARRSLAH